MNLAAVDALGQLHEPLGQLIYQTLNGIQAAKEELIKRKDPRSFDFLIKALENRDFKVRVLFS